MMRDRRLIVEALSDGNFILEKDFIFYLNEDQRFTIPKGFKTDFGSIPQIFQSLISPIGKATKAYVLHDYLLTKMYEMNYEGRVDGVLLSSRKVCDEILFRAMIQLNVNIIQAYIVYGAVRLYAKFKK